MRRLFTAVLLSSALLGAACTNEPAATPTSSPSTATSRSTSPSASASALRLVMPQTLLGRESLSSNSDMQLYAFWLAQALKTAATNNTQAVHGSYGGTPGKGLLSVGVVLAKNASTQQIALAIDGMSSDANLRVANLQLRPQVGGSSGCGEALGGKSTICAWVDSDTIGLVIWHDQKPADASAELTQIRGAIVQR